MDVIIARVWNRHEFVEAHEVGKFIFNAWVVLSKPKTLKSENEQPLEIRLILLVTSLPSTFTEKPSLWKTLPQLIIPVLHGIRIQFYCDPLLDAVAGLDVVAVSTSSLSDLSDIGGAHPIDLVAFSSSCVEINFIILIMIIKDTINMHAGEKQKKHHMIR